MTAKAARKYATPHVRAAPVIARSTTDRLFAPSIWRFALRLTVLAPKALSALPRSDTFALSDVRKSQTHLERVMTRASLVVLVAGLLDLRAAPPASTAAKLRLEEIGADSTAFHAVATLIVGPTEVLAWDAQYRVADAQRVADKIAATGKKLKAIVISHPDHDHYMGAAKIVERFPGTPVYMTAAGLAEYEKTAPQQFKGEKARQPTLVPDSLVTPKPLPSMHLTVDGEAVEVIPDLTGDVLTPTNSFLWIPSLRTALAGDIAFNGVHPWLGASSEASRAAWREAVKRIADLHPTSVVAGHKKDIGSPDSPDVLKFMDQYLADFDSLRKTSANGDELRTAMLQKYPDLAVRGLLAFGARAAYQK